MLSKRHKKLLKAGKAFAELTTEQRHDLRIDLKKLRYTIDFFTPLFDKKAQKPFHAHLKALQNDLGCLNDVTVAETLLEDLLARPGKQDLRGAAGLVSGWHAHSYAANEPRLLVDWKNFTRQPAFWD